MVVVVVVSLQCESEGWQPRLGIDRSHFPTLAAVPPQIHLRIPNNHENHASTHVCSVVLLSCEDAVNSSRLAEHS